MDRPDGRGRERDERGRPDGLLAVTRLNAALAWTFVLTMSGVAVTSAVDGSLLWAAFVTTVVCVSLVPALAYRDPTVMPPWELLLIASAPALWGSLLGPAFGSGIATYLSVAAIALVVAVELDGLTAVRMNHSFAVGLVAIATLAVAGSWAVVRWFADVALGTSYLFDGRSSEAINAAVMVEFVYAALAGVGAGVVFDRYFRGRARTSSRRRPTPSPVAPPERERRFRDRIGIPERYERGVSRAMQASLVALVCGGLLSGDLSVVANGLVALAVTFVPAILERDYGLPMDPRIVLWITATVFLHAIGTAGLYDWPVRWDALTHALSASVVAAVGYTLVHAIDLYTDEIHLPPRAMVVLLPLFVLTAGVVWEILEFLLDLGAARLGVEAVLVQHGIEDTVADLLFNAVGALVVALWGTASLVDLSNVVSERLDEWRGAG